MRLHRGGGAEILRALGQALQLHHEPAGVQVRGQQERRGVRAEPRHAPHRPGWVSERAASERVPDRVRHPRGQQPGERAADHGARLITEGTGDVVAAGADREAGCGGIAGQHDAVRLHGTAEVDRLPPAHRRIDRLGPGAAGDGPGSRFVRRPVPEGQRRAEGADHDPVPLRLARAQQPHLGPHRSEPGAEGENEEFFQHAAADAFQEAAAESGLVRARRDVAEEVAPDRRLGRAVPEAAPGGVAKDHASRLVDLDRAEGERVQLGAAQVVEAGGRGPVEAVAHAPRSDALSLIERDPCHAGPHGPATNGQAVRSIADGAGDH